MTDSLPALLYAQIVFGEYTLPISLFELSVDFVVPLVFAGIAYRLAVQGLRRVTERLEISAEYADRLRRRGRRVLRLTFLAVVVGLTARLLGAEVWGYLGTVYRYLREPFFVSGNTRISILTVLAVIPVLYFASWASRSSKQALESRILDRLELDASQRFSISAVLRYVVMGLVLVFGLSILGIDLSSLGVFFGVLGIGLGFGLQTTVANVFSGLVIILTRPIKEGDRIEVNDYEGTVVQIRLISTVMNTLTNETLIIPNQQIVNSAMHNYSYEDRSIRIRNVVEVAYSSDLDAVKSVLLGVGHENPYRISEHEPIVFFRSFNDSGIEVMLSTWIRDTAEKYFAISWNNLEIWRAFKRTGIEIPFPQRDLYLKSVPPPVAGEEDARGTGEPPSAAGGLSDDGAVHADDTGQNTAPHGNRGGADRETGYSTGRSSASGAHV